MIVTDEGTIAPSLVLPLRVENPPPPITPVPVLLVVALVRTASAAAMVVANLLLDPALQAVKADPAVLGVPTVLDLDRLPPDQAALFAETIASPYLLTDYGTLVDELDADRVESIEQRWIDEIRSP